jgi:6-phosphogluconolactonase
MQFNIRRRGAAQLVAVAAALVTFGSPALAHDDDDDDGFRRGKLFMSTNGAGGNLLQVFARSATGPASLLASLPTGGSGTGGGLGSQGAVTLSTNGRYLFVVNAGSNSVSTFELREKGLELKSTVSSGGIRPTSVAENDGVVYVLNAPNGGAGPGNSVVGFRNVKGVLTPIADGTRALTDGSLPAQVSFDNDGDVLVISERAANRMVSYSVRGNGTLATSAAMTTTPGNVPFGFSITRRNVLVVSEAGTSSASSFRIGERNEPALTIISPAVANGEAAACWVAVTPNGRYAYTANAGASSISSYRIDRQGALTLVAARAAVMPANNGALDMATTPDGKQLHAFASRAPQQIVSYRVGADGSLTPLGALGGITPGSAGLAAN